MWVPFAASATVACVGAVAKFVLPVVAIRPIPIPPSIAGGGDTTTATGDVGVWYTFAPPIASDNNGAPTSPHHRVSIPLSVFYPIDKTSTPTTTTTTTSSTSWLPHDNDIRYANGLASYASIPKFIFRRLRSHTMVATTTTSSSSAAGSDGADGDPFPIDRKALSQDRIILFSHGLGGHRNMYSALCMSMAARGYVVISMEHCEGSACCAVPLYTPPFTPSSPPSTSAASPPVEEEEGSVKSASIDNTDRHHSKAYTMVPYMRPPVLEPHKNKSSHKHTAKGATPTKTHAELQDASDLHFREKQLEERMADVENIANAIRTKNLLGPLFGEEKDAATSFATSASLQLVGHSFGGATVVGAAARALESFRNAPTSTSAAGEQQHQAKCTVGGMPLLGFTALDVWLWPAKSLSDRVFINSPSSPASSPAPSPTFSPDSTTSYTDAATTATTSAVSSEIPFSVQFIDSEQWERWSENRNAIKELVDTINNSSSSNQTQTTPATADNCDNDAVVVPTPPRAVRHYTHQTDHLAASDMALFLTLGVGRKKYVDCKKSSEVIGEWAGLVLSQKS